MIAARKWPWFERLFGWAVARSVRRRFFNVYVGGLDHLRTISAEEPLVGCANHGNWWDGFMLDLFTRRHLLHDVHLAMEEKNLRRYSFFTRVGVFGLDLDKPGSARAGLRHALRLLRERSPTGRGRVVWMFVQGRLLPSGQRIEAKPGAGYLARQTGAALLPVSLRYEWLSESRPSVFVRVGAPLRPATPDAEVAAALTELYATTGAVVETGDWSDYQPMFGSTLSINKRWDRLRRAPGRAPADFRERNGS